MSEWLSLFKRWLHLAPAGQDLALSVAEATVAAGNTQVETVRVVPGQEWESVARAAAEHLDLASVKFGIALVSYLLGWSQPESALQKDLRALIKAPIRAGIEQFRMACVADTTVEGRAHREAKLRDALRSFEAASTLAEGDEHLLVLLMRAVCASQLKGGNGEAVQLFKEFGARARWSAESRRQAAKVLSQEVSAIRPLADGPAMSGTGGGPGLAGSAKAVSMAEKAEAVRRIQLKTERLAQLERAAVTLDEAATVATARASALRISGAPLEAPGEMSQ